jgi:hypothetical protein
MKPIEALMISLVKRYASEFVPAHMRNEFDVVVSDVRQMLAMNSSLASLANWVEKKTARIDTWQGLLDLPQPEHEADPYTAISEAIFKGQNLEISYQGNGGVMQHEVSPLAIIKRDQVLYVALRFMGYQDVRLVALHRIVDASVSQKPPLLNEVAFDLDAYLQDGLPFTLPGEKSFNLHLRFAESVVSTSVFYNIKHSFHPRFQRRVAFQSFGNGCSRDTINRLLNVHFVSPVVCTTDINHLSCQV